MRKILLTAALAMLAGGMMLAQDYTDSEVQSTGEYTQNDSTQQQIKDLQERLDALQAESDAKAAEKQKKDVWGRQKMLAVGYYSGSLKDPGGRKWNSKYGVSLINRKTYMLPSKAIGGFFKVGIDAKWIEMTYTKYSNQLPVIIGGGIPGNTIYVPETVDGIPAYPFPEEVDFGGYGDGDGVNLGGTQEIEIGLGVGLSANFAPFYASSNQLRFMRAALFCHFTPSASALLINDSGSTEFHVGFAPFVNAGFNVSWRMLEIGFEGRWGSAKYSKFDEDSFELDDFEDFDGSLPSLGSLKSKKSKFNMAGCRVYIGLKF